MYIQYKHSIVNNQSKFIQFKKKQKNDWAMIYQQKENFAWNRETTETRFILANISETESITIVMIFFTYTFQQAMDARTYRVSCSSAVHEKPEAMEKWKWYRRMKQRRTKPCLSIWLEKRKKIGKRNGRKESFNSSGGGRSHGKLNNKHRNTIPDGSEGGTLVHCVKQKREQKPKKKKKLK